MSLKERILALVRLQPGLTDRELADAVYHRGAPQQPVNQAARQLEGCVQV